MTTDEASAKRMEQANAPSEERTVVVIAGAGARGAYEAAALAEILPELGDLRSVILLGTSAGAINAVLWASRANGADLRTVGEAVKTVWRGIEQPRVFVQPGLTFPRLATQAATGLAAKLIGGLAKVTRPATGFIAAFGKRMSWVQDAQRMLVDSIERPLSTAAAPLRSLAHGYFSEVTGVLDPTPLSKTAEEVVDLQTLHENVSKGIILGVGVVATSCPMDSSGGRSRVFLEVNDKVAIPEPDKDSSIDYVATKGLTLQHVLASAAIPVAFPAVLVGQPGKPTNGDGEPDEYAGWYIDGGVRLNAPIEPAIKLGATRIIVVSSHATKYPTSSNSAPTNTPDVLDVAAQSVHAVLADGMIEDLKNLDRINHILATNKQGDALMTASGRKYRKVEVITVSPDNGALPRLAAETLKELSIWQTARYWFFSGLLSSAGRGEGNRELLSYLLFEPKYFERQFELATERARQVVTLWRGRPEARGRSGGRVQRGVQVDAMSSGGSGHGM